LCWNMNRKMSISGFLFIKQKGIMERRYFRFLLRTGLYEIASPCLELVLNRINCNKARNDEAPTFLNCIPTRESPSLRGALPAGRASP